MLKAVIDKLIDLTWMYAYSSHIIQEDCGKNIFPMELEVGQKDVSGNVIVALLESLIVVTFEHLEFCDHSNHLIEISVCRLPAIVCITILIFGINAVAYLASYLSCAKFVQPSIIISMLKSLARWCYSHCEKHSKMHNVVTNPDSHTVFYATCQIRTFKLSVLFDSEKAYDDDETDSSDAHDMMQMPLVRVPNCFLPERAPFVKRRYK